MSNRPHYSVAEIEAALEACAREPVHIPGAIQPMGCLVSAHPETNNRLIFRK